MSASHTSVANKPVQYTYCSYCSAKYTELVWPRKCQVCGNETYRNPASVAVVLQPVDDGLSGGIRGIPPEVGKSCLISGFQDWGEDLRETSAREASEENNLTIDPKDLTFLWEPQAADGKGRNLCFYLAPWMSSADLPPFVPNHEVRERLIIREADIPHMAFTLHAEAARRYFAKRRLGVLDRVWVMFDVETTGPDPATCQVTEIGLAAGSIARGVFASTSTLICPDVAGISFSRGTPGDFVTVLELQFALAKRRGALPKPAMQDIARWYADIERTAPRRPGTSEPDLRNLAGPSAFDWGFVTATAYRGLGENPFGFKADCSSTYLKAWGIEEKLMLPHRAEEDARLQLEQFLRHLRAQTFQGPPLR